MSKILLILLICFSFIFFANAQSTTFSKRFPVSNHLSTFSTGVEINQKFYAVGYLLNLTTFSDDGYLVITDSNGNKVFGKVVREIDSISYLLGLGGIITDGTYLYASGLVAHPDTSFIRKFSQDPILIKFDTLGNMIWYRNDYRSANRYYFDNQDLELVGNQLIHVGNNVYENASGIRISGNSVIFWMDTAGNVIRSKEYNLSVPDKFEKPWDYEPLPDGGFILSGELTNNGNGGKMNGFVMRGDSLGNTIWSKSYGEVGRRESIFSTTVLADGNYLACGFRSRDENLTGERAAWDGWLLKLNPNNGDTIWTKRVNAAYYNDIIQTFELPNGDLMVGGGGGFAGDSANADAQIMRLDAMGNIIWAKRYGWPYDRVTFSISAENIYDFQQTSDGGYLIIGDARGWGAPNPQQSGWLLKLDSNGCLVSGCGSVGITEYEVFNIELNAYPNPAQDVLNVKGNLQSGDIIALYDYTGKQVLQYAVAAGEEMQLNTGNLATGIYLLRLNRNNRSMITKRVMINR